jgi:subtilisin-like proprotein convertase family protein
MQLSAGFPSFVVSLMVALLSPEQAAAEVFSAGPSLGIKISDGPTPGIPGATAQSSIQVPLAGALNALTVSVGIDHTWVGDLRITLTPPVGADVTLVDRPGVPGFAPLPASGYPADLSAANPITFDDDAEQPAETLGGLCTPVTVDPITGELRITADLVVGEDCPGDFAPDDPLDDLRGQPTQGTWTLSVTDWANGDTGTLQQWSLNLSAGAGGTSEGALENPQPDAFASGIGLVSGWYCDAERIEIQFNDEAPKVAAYGTNRGDTSDICGDIDNGFGLLWNFSLLGNGRHTIRAFADGTLFASAEFTVTTFGVEFLRGVSGSFRVPDFPVPGAEVILGWQEAFQNFVLERAEATSAAATQDSKDGIVPSPVLGILENPQGNGSASGIGLVSGWYCDAEEIQIQFNDEAPKTAAYGTNRGDTAEVCGDIDNGFGLLWNFNLLGDGVHTVRALADGEEFARADFQVATLGVEFLRGAQGEYQIPDFPAAGGSATLRWQEASQNFVIRSASGGPPPVVDGPVTYGGKTEPAPITAAGVDRAIAGVGIYVPGCEEVRELALSRALTELSLGEMGEKLVAEAAGQLTYALAVAAQSVVGYVKEATRVDKAEARSVTLPPVPGPCGGTIAFTGLHDNGDTDGTIKLADFCVENAGVQTKATGDIAIGSDGDPSPTGPVTKSFTGSTPDQLELSNNQGDAFSLKVQGLKYDYGRPNVIPDTPTLADPDKLSVASLLVRNNRSGNVTKLEDVKATIGYLSPVPSVYTQSSGTVQVSASGDLFFPNTGVVKLETTQPMVIDRSTESLTAATITATGAGGDKVTLVIDPAAPGVFTVSSTAAGYEGSILDCKSVSLEPVLKLVEAAIRTIQSGGMR